MKELVLHAEEDHALDLVELLGHLSILRAIIVGDVGHLRDEDLVEGQIHLYPSPLHDFGELLKLSILEVDVSNLKVIFDLQFPDLFGGEVGLDVTIHLVD